MNPHPMSTVFHHTEKLIFLYCILNKAKAEEFLGRLNTVDTSSLNKSDKINYDILKDNLQTFLNGNLWAM